MEQLLHYIWKHRMYPLGEMHTNTGETVEVIDPGLHNKNAGPDFFNAKIKIGGVLWVGNVEIHDKATDWYLHGHQDDDAYDNVILHVVGVDDGQVSNSRGEVVRQMQMDVPQYVRDNYAALLHEDRYPPCHSIVPELSMLSIHSWLSALQTERLEQKTEAIRERLRKKGGSWEDAYFMTMARGYGFGINGDAFEEWARVLSLQSAAHHRDDIFQVEAMFLGQAGLLNPDAIPARHRAAAEGDAYFMRLRSEYTYLSHKFHLEEMDARQWRFLRLRPQNFPHIRISQLANLYYNHSAGLRQMVETEDVYGLRALLSTQATPYWQTHYTFGHESKKSEKRLSRSSIDVLIVNTVVPVLFAYGRHQCDERLCERAFDILQQLKAENNNVVRLWAECGIKVETAADSQALIQLHRQYCDRRDCLRCRIGYEYIKRHGWLLKENEEWD